MKPNNFTSLFISILFWANLVFSSCTPREEEITTDPGARLSFSTDSIIFDTVFSELRNVTKRLRVRNPNDRAINISRVMVAGGDQSPYSIIVNGDEGNSVEDVEIWGGDSIFVLITVDVSSSGQNDPFLVEDSILFLTNGNLQTVYLRSWGQDAIFYEDSLLACDIRWTNEKPIVLIDLVGVDTNCTLTIEPGTQVHLSSSTSFLVWGTLDVQGTAADPVVFQGIRREPEFSNAPGQWGANVFRAGIWFLDPSNGNSIDWARIRNGTNGIQIGNVYDVNRPDLSISNTVIENMSQDGIVSYGGSCDGENLLINNCAQYGIGAFLGGTWRLRHCTVASYGFDFSRDDPSIIVTDWFPDSTGIFGSNERNPMDFAIANSISWGNQEDEFLFSFELPTQSTLAAVGSYFRVSDRDQSDFLELLGNFVFRDIDSMQFQDPGEYNYRIDSLSQTGRNRGEPAIVVPRDLDDTPRSDGLPDPGAYELDL